MEHFALRIITSAFVSDRAKCPTRNSSLMDPISCHAISGSTSGELIARHSGKQFPYAAE